ncbi:MAG: methyltransferase domain-containing protein [Candidatus Portnoybacteria bacterium]|nr:methyltransferase domain-containing protein [Candidatus Portnoybacteria bacterium]
MDLNYAKKLIEKNKKDFNIIANQFSQTRKYLWPELKKLKKYIKRNTRVVDMGCGNGRLFNLFKNKNIDYIGIDISESLIQKAKEEYGDHFKQANILNLPFKDNSFNQAWMIAVLHHIPSRELRIQALKEIKRVLKKNGNAIITCWNLYQPRYFKILFKYTFRKIFKKSKLDFKDVFIPWKRKNIQRYYHAFTKKELKKELKKAGFEVKKIQHLKRKNKKLHILAITKKP